MASGYYNLPGYNPGGAINFEPMTNALNRYGDVQRHNAMQAYKQQRDEVEDKRANAMLSLQQQAGARQQKQFDEEMGSKALSELAGIYQAIEASPEAERAALYSRVQPIYSRLRTRIPDFDADLAEMGIDPNDHMAVGKLVMGRAAGYQDPLAREKTRAEINKLNAQARNEGVDSFGKTGAVFQDVDGKQYTIQFSGNGERRILPLDGLTQARGTRVTGDTVQDIATGRDLRNVGGAIAGGERAKAIGKSEGELVGSLPKLEMGFKVFSDKSDRLVNVIDRAISRVGPNTTGWGALLASLPATEARALQTDLDTIRANVGFEELQAMRDASPTGGALGQVSEMENRLLQSIRGSLDQLNEGQNLAENLRIIRESVAQLKALKAEQMAADRARVGSMGSWRGGGEDGAPTAPPPSSGGFRYLGPAD